MAINKDLIAASGFWQAWLDHEVDDATLDSVGHLDACADCRTLAARGMTAATGRRRQLSQRSLGD